MPFSISAVDALTLTPIILNRVAVKRGDLVLSTPLSAQIHAKDICQITGENGAGKTSLLMGLAGLVHYDLDALSWQNLPSSSWLMLYMGVKAGMNAQLTVFENLKFIAQLTLNACDLEDKKYTVTDDELLCALAQVGLKGYEDESVRHLSSGQKRRVSLARLWLNRQPPLWVLDEPFTALDVAMVARLNQQIKTYADQGGRVILTSHQPVENVTLSLAIERPASGVHSQVVNELEHQ